MEWITGIQRAVDYVEAHLLEPLDADAVAAQAYCSTYHFLRLFGMLSGVTLGEYVRNRRLTLAGTALQRPGARVLDVALEMGYESPEGFTRAFTRFHGISPCEARAGGLLRAYSPLSIHLSLQGGAIMQYRIEQKPAMTLTGIRRRFTGVPYGPERERQEEALFVSTRGAQWMLSGLSPEPHDTFAVIDAVDADGYDFWITTRLREWNRAHLYDAAVTGIGFMREFGFEECAVPQQTYAVFPTEKCKQPVAEYADIRKRIVSEWMPTSGYAFANAPELALYHWVPGSSEKCIEIWMPVEQA